jgi:hypothetical protein
MTTVSGQNICQPNKEPGTVLAKICPVKEFSKNVTYGIWENVVLQNGHDYFSFSIETTIYSMEIDILRLWLRHFDANFDVHLWWLLPNVARLLTIFWDVRYYTKTKPSTKVNLWIKRACAKLIVVYMCTNLNERRFISDQILWTSFWFYSHPQIHTLYTL